MIVKTSGSKSNSQILENLNEVQQEAVMWTEGPILILAGAGSGKTRVLTHKIAYLVEVQKVKPWSILAMTFTNKAAGEMMERIRTLTQKASDAIWMGTFHSLFARILRRECERIGYQSNFSIYDADDQSRLIKMIIEEQNIPIKKAVPRALHSHISRLKNQLISPERFQETARDAFDLLVAQIYPIYQQRLHQQNAMDFDDLLLKPIELFTNSPATLEQYRERFHYLLIDEYQDTNRAQYLLIKMLSEKHRNICVVGDDDQSIYKWRGADVQNILDFEKDFPECRIFRLEQNYRSTKNILAAASSVVKNNSDRLDKTLWTTKSDGDKVGLLTTPNAYLEAAKVVDKIQDEFRLHKRNFRDFAILYRTNAQSRILEDSLRNNGIAYLIVGGTRFYERKEVKDILAYLRCIVNPWDTISLKRIINFPPRNLGPASLKKIDQFAQAQHLSFFEALSRATAIAGLGETAQVRAYNFYKLIEKYQNLLAKLSISELTRSLVDEIGVLTAFKIEGTVEAMSRYENVMELLTAITEFSKRTENPTLPAFLEEVSLITDIDTWDERGNAVTLMTLHAAKGLEFPVVFITGLEEGLFPLSRSSMTQGELEEERRLFYVGATRSQEKLFLSCALQRGFGGNLHGSIPSRFINEIDPQYLEDEEQVAQAKRSSTLRSRSRSHRATEGIYYEYEAEPMLADASALFPTLEIGMQVRHPIFGEGTIEDLEGHAESQKVTVNFSRVGPKRLVVKYANLEIIKSYD